MSEYKNFLKSLVSGQTVYIVRPHMNYNDKEKMPFVTSDVVSKIGKKFLTIGTRRFFRETGREDSGNYAAWIMPSLEAAEKEFEIRKALSALRHDIDQATRVIYEGVYRETPNGLTENISLEEIADISTRLKALSALAV